MTPFEIRLELLKMAKDIVSEEFHTNVSRINEDWHTKVEVAKLNGGEIPSHPGYPAYPSEKDIISKAQDLNGFVSNIETKPTVVTKRNATSTAA
jgi:proteasome lid subunit RPN8/RPN11